MDELSPVQQEVLEQIGAVRESWPEFPAELRYELRGELEKGTAEHVQLLGDDVSIWGEQARDRLGPWVREEVPGRS